MAVPVLRDPTTGLPYNFSGTEDRIRKKQAFLEHYCGTMTRTAQAMKLAGISVDARTLTRYVKADPELRRAIKTRGLQLRRLSGVPEDKVPDYDAVSSRSDRQALWSRMMNDPTLEPQHRIKASELLAKSQLDFDREKGGGSTLDGWGEFLDQIDEERGGGVPSLPAENEGATPQNLGASKGAGEGTGGSAADPVNPQQTQQAEPSENSEPSEPSEPSTKKSSENSGEGIWDNDVD
jgi:hypothetical protein